MRVSEWKLLLRCVGGFRGFCFSRIALGVLPAESLHAAGCVHKLLFAGKEGVAGSADFYADVALMGGAGDECVAASAMHADLTVMWMNGCFHVGSQSSIQTFDFTGVRKDSARQVSGARCQVSGKSLTTHFGFPET